MIKDRMELLPQATRKRRHLDIHINQADRQKGEGTVDYKDTISENGTVDDEVTVGQEVTADDEESVDGYDLDTSQEGATQDQPDASDEDEECTPVVPGRKTHINDTDKSVVDDLSSTAPNLCPMLRPLAGQRAQTIRSLITWIAFVLLRWHISNNVAQSALLPLLQLICQVLSVAGARKFSSVAAEAFPHTMF